MEAVSGSGYRPVRPRRRLTLRRGSAMAPSCRGHHVLLPIPRRAPSRATTPQVAGTFHHIVVTYTGQTGSPAFTETIYVDGAQNQQYVGRQLSILRSQDPLLGGYSDPESGDFALAVLRVHDGALTAAQVREGAAVSLAD
jgi:hypothetical protein